MNNNSGLTANLSPFQKRLIATALALTAAVVIVMVAFAAFILLRILVTTFSSVIWPLAVAGILSMILRPVVEWFNQQLKLGKVKSIALLYSLVLLAFVGVISYLIPLLFEQAFYFAEHFPEIINNLRNLAAEKFPRIREFLATHIGEDKLASYQESFSTQLKAASEQLFLASGSLLSKIKMILSIGTGLAIVPVYLFFFLETDVNPIKKVSEQLSFLKKEHREDILYLIQQFADSMVAFFRGQIIIGLIMAVLLATGFSIAGINFGLALGFIIGVLNIIPYFGTIIGLTTILPIAYFQPEGGPGLMLTALGIFVTVQMIEGYILTPRIMGGQTGLHPLAIIIAIFFWGAALGGILGMVFAIPLTAFFVVAWRLIRKKYLNPLRVEAAGA